MYKGDFVKYKLYFRQTNIPRNYIHIIVYVIKQINFHKRSYFGDMLLQLGHLKILINISIFEFRNCNCATTLLFVARWLFRFFFLLLILDAMAMVATFHMHNDISFSSQLGQPRPARVLVGMAVTTTGLDVKSFFLINPIFFY